MLYRLTDGGPYYDETILGFIEGPDGLENEIISAVTDYANAVKERIRIEQAEAEMLAAKFKMDNPIEPKLLGKTFAEFYPEEARILSVGKKHKHYTDAKLKNVNFIESRNLRHQEIDNYNKRKREFIDSNRISREPITIKLPDGCRLVSEHKIITDLVVPNIDYNYRLIGDDID